MSRIFTIIIIAIAVCISCARAPVKQLLSKDFHAFIVNGNHQNTLRNFERFLRANRVDNLVPTEQLLRQGTDWKRNKLPQYAFPPESAWPKMTETLKLMRRFIIPVTGPVDVVSGFRTTRYNLVAGGAPRSQHLVFSALDVIPRTNLSRAELHKNLLQIWRTHGKSLNMGLGLYRGRRFHIDSGGYRKW